MRQCLGDRPAVPLARPDTFVLANISRHRPGRDQGPSHLRTEFSDDDGAVSGGHQRVVNRRQNLLGARRRKLYATPSTVSGAS